MCDFFLVAFGLFVFIWQKLNKCMVWHGNSWGFSFLLFTQIPRFLWWFLSLFHWIFFASNYLSDKISFIFRVQIYSCLDGLSSALGLLLSPGVLLREQEWFSIQGIGRCLTNGKGLFKYAGFQSGCYLSYINRSHLRCGAYCVRTPLLVLAPTRMPLEKESRNRSPFKWNSYMSWLV